MPERDPLAHIQAEPIRLDEANLPAEPKLPQQTSRIARFKNWLGIQGKPEEETGAVAAAATGAAIGAGAALSGPGSDWLSGVDQERTTDAVDHLTYFTGSDEHPGVEASDPNIRSLGLEADRIEMLRDSGVDPYVLRGMVDSLEERTGGYEREGSQARAADEQTPDTFDPDSDSDGVPDSQDSNSGDGEEA